MYQDESCISDDSNAWHVSRIHIKPTFEIRLLVATDYGILAIMRRFMVLVDSNSRLSAIGEGGNKARIMEANDEVIR